MGRGNPLCGFPVRDFFANIGTNWGRKTCLESIPVKKTKMRILRWLARRLLRLLGWQLVEDIPSDLSKAVLVVAPHTSNWDGFYGLLFCFAKKMPIKFAIKKEALFFPLGFFLRRLGAIPIDRKRRGNKGQGTVQLMVDLFPTQKELLLIIAPEGTRGHVKRWKQGFYRVAQQAHVPIVLGFIDYGKKRLGFGPVFQPTGDIEEDLKEIQAFYKDKQGRHPAQGVV